LNATEVEQSYVVAGLCAYAHSLSATAISAALSYYDVENNIVFLHLGRKDVLRIEANSISIVANGAYNVFFPWNVSADTFLPTMHEYDWTKTLFGDCVGNVISASQSEVLTLLRVWLLFLLFRDAAVSRPILALFGQPGAGKSTLFRRIYTFLYGARKALSAVSDASDFDHAVAIDPLVVLDNVDSWERWLPDRLALSASSSDIVKRKLYTDLDTITLRRQALLGITAHNPHFGREDVADRMLIITFERLPCFKPEEDIVREILAARDHLWGGIVKDVQRVLATPKSVANVPQFRVADFARVGMRIATALNIADEFSNMIDHINVSQHTFSLDEDELLVTAMHILIRKQKSSEFKSASVLWSELELCAPDALAFARAYRNAVFLGKKLWALHNALKEVITIEWRLEKDGSRRWRIAPKEQDGG